MKRLVLGCAAVLLSGAASAQSTALLCSQMTAEQHGIRCRVSDIDGLGGTLLIRNHTRNSDDEARIVRARASTRQAIDTFIGEGGVFIKMRTTRPDGVEMERTCSKVKGRKSEHCGEWSAVSG